MHLRMMHFCIIMDHMTNPFRFGSVVTAADFCPRPDLVAQLRSCLEARQNVVLLGERRTGKTSLIFETARRTRGLRLVYAQLWAVKSVEDVASRLLRAISTAKVRENSFVERVARSFAYLRPRIEFDPTTGQPSITVSPGTKMPPEGLHGVFDFLEELGTRHRLAIVLDEFQDIQQIDQAQALLGELRSRIQRPGGVPCVFAGSIRHDMERIFRDPSSPFFKSMRTLEVQALPRGAFQKFLAVRFASGQLKVPDATFDSLFDLAQDNPGDVQQFCAAIWDVSSPGEIIDAKRVQAALAHVLVTERKGYESQVHRLTSNQIKCLRALAHIGGKRPQSREFLIEAGIDLPASVKRALTRLIDLEIIYGREMNHKFFDPFFKQWVLKEL
jgi:uncharacterized protein